MLRIYKRERKQTSVPKHIDVITKKKKKGNGKEQPWAPIMLLPNGFAGKN